LIDSSKVAVTYDLYHVDLREKDMGEYVASIVLIPEKGKKTWEGRAFRVERTWEVASLLDLRRWNEKQLYSAATNVVAE